MTTHTTVAPPTPTADPSPATAGKYLTFQLDTETYGLEILKVQEIIGMMNVTRVPRTPPFLRGVINLRGRVIPVVDLRLKFGLQPHPNTERTCIIVVHVANPAQQGTTGLIVDEVCEVLAVQADQIEPPPAFAAALATNFIRGIAKVPHKVVILLDADKVLDAQTVAALAPPT